MYVFNMVHCFTNAQLQKCTIAEMHNCRNAQLQKCTIAEMHNCKNSCYATTNANNCFANTILHNSEFVNLVSLLQKLVKTMDEIVTSSIGFVNAFAGTKRTKVQSIRRRKFTTEELSRSRELITPAVESGMEGPFWFQKSTTTFQNDEKVHHGITKREHQLLREIVKSGFYTEDRLRNTLVPLNDESSNTPRLRAFDWAVTNFAKGSPQLQVVGSSIMDPNLDYQNELKKHHRLLFDPFRRGTHLFFELSKSPDDLQTEVHRTTVGQLCFVKWCVEHKVDKYVEANLDQIRVHMSNSTKKNKNQKRRKELTSAPKQMLRGAIFESLTIV